MARRPRATSTFGCFGSDGGPRRFAAGCGAGLGAGFDFAGGLESDSSTSSHSACTSIVSRRFGGGFEGLISSSHDTSTSIVDLRIGSREGADGLRGSGGGGFFDAPIRRWYPRATSVGERAFNEPAARAKTKAAIQSIESKTSAEVVVAVRHASGRYLDANLLFGCAVGFVALTAMLFVDRPFPLAAFPVYTAAAVAIGAFVASRQPWIQRAFSRSGRRRADAHARALAAFVELGVSKTTRRSGILVYVSMVERRVEVVADVAIDAAALGTPYQAAIATLRASIDPRPNLEKFIAALESLGPVLATVYPHHDGDANELPDDPNELADEDAEPAEEAP